MLLTECCDVLSGVSFPKKPFSEDAPDYFVLESSGVDSSGNLLHKALVQVTVEQFPIPSKALRPNDLLIRAKGTQHKAMILWDEQVELPIIPTSYFLIVRPKPNHNGLFIPSFLAWQLNQPKHQSALRNLSGGTTVKHLTKSRISSLQVEFPPLAKQRVVMELEEFRQQESKLEEKRRALLQEHYKASCEQYLGKEL